MRDLKRLDWNLIPALDALLSERNVSRAAARLGVTQPTASATLARLRRLFDDDLMVRVGGGYTLTPLGEHLATAARASVETAARVLDTRTGFDPATSTREFTVAASDYALLTVGAELHRAIERSAPSARLRLVSPFLQFKSDREVLTGADGWIAPNEMLPGEEHLGTMLDRWVCVVDADHDAIGEHLSLDVLRDVEWVAPTVRGGVLRLLVEGLSALGVEPRIAATTDSFSAVPFLVEGTRRVGLVQERLAQRLDAATIRVLPCPWPVQALQLTFWWDRQRIADPAHRWLRSLTADLFDQIGDTGLVATTTLPIDG